MKHVLVTGANGFVGKHLIKELVGHGINVKIIGGHQMTNSSAYTVLDLSSPKEAEKINFKGIDGVIHLAGLAAVGPSFDNPMEYVKINMGIEINLFETAIKQNARPSFLIVSSGTLYDPRSKLPLTEDSFVQPSSPYAISKLGQEQLAMYYMSRGFKCIVARPFNHFGPGQNPGFIVPDLIEQAINVERGKAKDIHVGNLAAKRDYTDVRDIVRGYRLLLSAKSGEIYNICSGKPISGQQILDTILNEIGTKPNIIVDKSKFRPSDADVIYGSYQKLTKATDWKPEIAFKTTIKDTVNDWRSKSS